MNKQNNIKIPEIKYINSEEENLKEIDPNYSLLDIKNFVKELKKSDLYSELFWKEALKEKHFMPLFSLILFFKREEVENLTKFLKESFYKDIETKIKDEIQRDLENLASDVPEINKTSLIYTIHEPIFDFFSSDDKKAWEMLELSKFYDDGIFENLLELRNEDALSDVNFYLLASLLKWDFNEEFFTGDKYPVGNILDLEYKNPSEDEQKMVFANEILSLMFREIETFYFILRSGEFYDIADYLRVSDELMDYFYNSEFKKKALKYYIENEYNLPPAFIESCDELEELFTEEELEEIAEKVGYETFEEVCDEYEEYFFNKDEERW